MERMEPDAAAQGIKDWIGQKMIQIDHHGQQHNQGKPLPSIRKGKLRQNNRDQEMAKGVHFSYERYLMNQIRDEFGFDKVPIKLIFRKKR